MKFKYLISAIFVVLASIILLNFDKVKISLGYGKINAVVSGEHLNKGNDANTQPIEKSTTTSEVIYQAHGKNSPIINSENGSTVINYEEK